MLLYIIYGYFYNVGAFDGISEPISYQACMLYSERLVASANRLYNNNNITIIINNNNKNKIIIIKIITINIYIC